MTDLNPKISESINIITDRLTEIDGEYYMIAAKRLEKISEMSFERLKEYFNSIEYLEDNLTDANNLRKLLNNAFKENIKNAKQLAREIINTSYEEGTELIEAKSEQ